jgi:hypothetical protein
MKTTLVKTLSVLALVSLLSPLRAGTEVLLYPLARAFGGPSENQAVWRQDLAKALRREIGSKSGAKIGAPETTPVVNPTDFGHNQLRYLWSRAAEYGKWVKSTHPAGDYVLFTEVFARDGKVGAIHVFVLDTSGQLAYCRLFNSHQFGPNLTSQGDEAILLIVKHLFDDLTKEPTKIFPPYGVG